MSTRTDENESRSKKTAGVLRHRRKQRDKQAAYDRHEVGHHAANADRALERARQSAAADDDD